MDKEKVLEEAERFMKKNVPKARLPEEDYFRHIFSVKKYALQLAEIYNADRFVVEAAAFLHDVGADAGHEHAGESAKIAKPFLEKFDLPKETLENILKAIENHSMGCQAETIEQQVIQDADGISFIEGSYPIFFQQRKERFPLEEARKLTIEKVKGMLNKIKTEEGQKLAKNLMPKAIEWLEKAE